MSEKFRRALTTRLAAVSALLILGNSLGVPGYAADADNKTADSGANNPSTTAIKDIEILPSGGGSATTSGAASSGTLMVKPGQSISVGMQAEDINPTDDVQVAQQQALKYPDSPEASFILAVALTRTSRVEEALKEVRHAKHLAQAQGGASYFDHMIQSYEKMLEYCPDDNRVRYMLAWAYYMKAYLLTKETKQAAPAAAPVASADSKKTPTVKVGVAAPVLSMLSPQLSQNLPADGKISTSALPHIPSALENAPPSVVPQVKNYYEQALKNLDDLLTRKPDDMWARVYRAHLYAEYTGDLAGAMQIWRDCQKKCPQNPAPYFFLAEAYLRLGNLKESLSNISHAIALRALGN